MKRFLWLATIVLGWPGVASAITVDGSVDAEYGSAVAVQGTPTGFGNNFSELDAAYAKYEGGTLSLMLTGNIQNNGNSIVLMIDSRLGGAVVSSLGDKSGVMGSVGGDKTDNWGTDTDGGAGVSTPTGGGSILDPGFNPDMALTFSHSGAAYFMNVIDLTQPNDDVHPDKDVYHDYYNGADSLPVSHTYTRTDGNVGKGHGSQLTHALNNSNTAGVTDTDASGPLTATTGFEIQLPAGFLNNIGQPIRIMAFITGGDGGFLANQFLGESGIGNVGNLGTPGGTGGEPLFDAREFDGNQFITIDTSAIYGDYNNDGSVNGADYVLWKKMGGTTAEYDFWCAHFGTPTAATGLSAGSVPEPAAVLLAVIGALLGVGAVRRR